MGFSRGEKKTRRIGDLRRIFTDFFSASDKSLRICLQIAYRLESAREEIFIKFYCSSDELNDRKSRLIYKAVLL